MKIIHVLHGKANPDGHNGISRVVYHLNREQKLQGIDSQIWALVDGTKTHFTHKRDEFVTVECFPRVRLPIGTHEIIEHLIDKKNSIDIVHLHLIWFFDKNIIASSLKKAGIPFIITTHGTYSKPHALTGKRLIAKYLFEVAYLNMATEIHCITREEGTTLRNYGYKGRCFVAPNGIDPAEIPRIRKSDSFSEKPYKKKIKLIWVGVMREDKNLQSLIEAVAMLPIALRDTFVCVLVGPDYKGNAKRYLSHAESLGCAENFDYIGPLYGAEKYDAIQSADAHVLPSVSEVFSLAALDAMACGKAGLVSSGCGYNYFLRSEFFILCEPFPQDIALGVEELLSCRAEWEKMGRNARSLIERELNWKEIAKVTIANYQRIIEAVS